MADILEPQSKSTKQNRAKNLNLFEADFPSDKISFILRRALNKPRGIRRFLRYPDRFENKSFTIAVPNYYKNKLRVNRALFQC
jgi:hypothetical protein